MDRSILWARVRERTGVLIPSTRTFEAQLEVRRADTVRRAVETAVPDSRSNDQHEIRFSES